jgi:calcium-dependent protein kinase
VSVSIQPIGKGAYGTVYQAKMMQPPFADRVVKVIQKRLVRNPDSLKNEYMILKKLDHPNIVKLY